MKLDVFGMEEKLSVVFERRQGGLIMGWWFGCSGG